ncbi:hypothetical protein HMPREF0576_1602 [Mobiluncus holmesii ATCC 35242]|uniref:Uncharacterized protein n=2 Tax=Mobiluncus TaxID=2050 RepID=E6M5L2_9ACTO|nr:hypothetical protein HMPREF0388_0203 [Mobiluncus curtisii ATCC 51333]EFU81760.1 hypothetical protein HMPREF0576_1602 [Mobiluncus holmesii ATCC 35242]
MEEQTLLRGPSLGFPALLLSPGFSGGPLLRLSGFAQKFWQTFVPA